MNIVVLCGGTSTEREISIKTSEKVAAALESKGHKIILLDVFFGLEKKPDFGAQDIHAAADEYRALTGLLNDELEKSREFFGPNVLELCKAGDIVFMGLHGANGEDGKVQAAFDLMKIKYTGSGYLGSAIAMSKDHTKALLSEHIRMPEGIVLKSDDPFSKKMHVPCVVKPSNGGSSVGVVIVEKEEDYEAAVLDVFRYDDTVLVEEFVDGRELTQGVLAGEALPPVEICPGEGFYDYTNKYNGKTTEICPAQIPEDILKEMSEYSIMAGNILNLSVYYRLDYLLDKNGKLYCLEANTLPGMTDTSLIPQEAQAVGIDYPSLCEKIIELSLKKYE